MSHSRMTASRRAMVATALAAITLTGAAAQPPGAAAQTAAGGLCVATGAASISPGLSALSSHGFSFVASVRDSLCLTTDPSITSATASVTGTGWGSCLGFTATGAFTTTWNNGRESQGTFSSTTLGLIQTTEGIITNGEFSGLRISEIHILTGPNPLECLSATGLTDASFDGTFRVAPN
jgi:hypothetical protein